MSLSLANADTRIARVIGGAGDTNMLARAREALADAMEELQLRNDWSFFLTDTSQSFSVVSATHGNTTLDTAVADGFASVLVGMSVVGSVDIPANTTVAAKLTTTSILLSQAAAGSSPTMTATFGGTIPVIAGTDSYVLPTRFWKPYSCRLTSSSHFYLRFVMQREWDLQSYDQAIRGMVTDYTIYNPTVFDSGSAQQAKIKFFRVPDAADVALLRYYRPFDITHDPVDIPDEYLNTIILLAQSRLLYMKNATDERLPILQQKAEIRVRQMIAKDRNEGGEDEYERFHTPDEASGPWRGDPFYPRGDYGH